MNKKLLVIGLLVLCLVPTMAFASSDPYVEFIESTRLINCWRFGFNNATGEVIGKIYSSMGALYYDEYSVRGSCDGGYYTNKGYNRHIHINLNDLENAQEAIDSDFFVSNSQDDNNFPEKFFVNEISNTEVWGLFYMDTQGEKLNSQDAPYDRFAKSSTWLNSLNELAEPNYFSGDRIPKSDWSEVFGATFHAGDIDLDPFSSDLNNYAGWHNYLVNTGEQSNPSFFTDIYPSGLAPQEPNPWDVDVFTQGHFFFSDYLNYYYYPYFINELDIVVYGFDDNTSMNLLYTKLVTLTPNSNNVYLRGYDLVGSAGLQIINDWTNYGTEIVYDDVLTTLPSNVGYVEISASQSLERNPLYRHLSPADSSWTYNDVFYQDDADGDLKADYLYYTLPVVKLDVPTGSFLNTPTMGEDSNNNSNQNDLGSNFNDSEFNNVADDPVFGSSSNFTGGVDWSGEIGESGALQNMRLQASIKNEMAKKNSFFIGLQIISERIFLIFITLVLLVVVVISIFAFFILIPSAYNKMLKKYQELIREVENMGGKR